MWDWFYFIYSFSAVLFVFGIIWKFVVALPLTILVAFTGTFGKFLLKIGIMAQYYFFAAYALLIALGIKHFEKSPLFLTVAGVFLMFFCFSAIGGKTKNMEQQFRQDGDVEMYRMIRYDYYGMVGSFVLFVVMIFYPELAINGITQWFITIMEKAQEYTILNWIIIIVGFFNALNILFFGFTALLTMVMMAFSREKPSYQS